MAQEFRRVPSEAGPDLTDGVDSKSAGLSERLHGGTVVMSGCLGKRKGLLLVLFYLGCTDF